jgi:hypothetical protein
MRRFFSRAGAVFAPVFAWKAILLIFTGQPLPMSDAYFYDRAVVNWLLHGKYANPSLALVMPIAGREVFSAYPPRYQASLLGWMSLFGVSAISAMARPDLARVSTVNTARIPAPDASTSLQRVVQHISWAPVSVSLQWVQN